MKRVRIGLTTKVVVGLLLANLLPLAASVFMVRQVAVVAQNVAVGEAERLHVAAERAREAYKEAFDARKAAFQASADLLATRPALRDACRGTTDAAALEKILKAEVARDPYLVHVALKDARATRELSDPDARRLELTRPLAEAPECTLELVYATETGGRLLRGLQELGSVLGEHRHLERIRQTLPPSYRTAFALTVGGFALATTMLAIFVARRTLRRIARLVAATRRVAEGDLETRVDLAGGDELSDLARAFDDMVAELARSRTEIEYLQKIGAWQEIARRLAHEIKNPLTPIQLSIQELASKYKGDDARYKKMLEDAKEIVTEEIAGLRRLVDAFSGFAKLPRVEPRPVDLATIVEDAQRELPGVALEISPPSAPVSVEGDRLLLKRVLVNLVENAAQAGAKRVAVSWRHADALVRLTVEDDGPGVPPELAERVFDPYVTAKPHGTGLGLAIVKKTILEHGGSIRLRRDRAALGGAAFDVTLPVLGSRSDPSSRA